MTMMIRTCRPARRLAAPTFGVWALLCLTSSFAETVPARGVVDSRIRTAAYNGDEVYRLRGFVGYQIDLEFEPGETFTGLGAGDLEGLSFVGQDNHLFLKPKAARVATNLTVLTSRRHYQFDYTALAQRPAADDPDVIYALRFTYPPLPSQSAADAAAKRLDSQLESAGNRAAAQHRLLVLRRARPEARRRLRRRCAHAAAFRGERRLAGDFRPQRRRQRVAAELQHGRGRRHHASRRAAVHSAARQAHRLHRESGIRRRRHPSGFRNRGARCRTPGARGRAMSGIGLFGEQRARRTRHHGRQRCALDAIARQQCSRDRPHEPARLGDADLVLRQCHDPPESGAAERAGIGDASCARRNAPAQPGPDRSARARTATGLRFGALAAAGCPASQALAPTSLREIPLQPAQATGADASPAPKTPSS